MGIKQAHPGLPAFVKITHNEAMYKTAIAKFKNAPIVLVYFVFLLVWLFRIRPVY